jgi:hypothetical protein
VEMYMHAQVVARVPGTRCNGLFFSTRSDASHPASLADEMANGDLDGDLFLVMYDAPLVMNLQQKLPWRASVGAAAAAAPAARTGGISGSLATHFIDARHSRSSMVGSCALQLLAIADRFDLAHPDAVALGGAYYLALDGEASCEPQLKLAWNQRRRWPAWMRPRTLRADIEFVQTNSCLSQMWNANLRGSGSSASSAPSWAWMDPDLNVSFSRHTGEKREVRGFAELKKKWEKLRKEYGVQMKEARRNRLEP